MTVELLPHQEKAVRELSNGKILYGGTGVGKTITALAYYEENEAPRDILVITTARKRDELDWETEANLFGINRTAEYSKYGSITVDSWNNIGKYEDVSDKFIIFDEQRLVGAGAWVKSFLKIAKKNRWIMLSATPGDNWLDYIPVFVANGLYKNRTEFKWKHVVYKPYMKYPVVDHYMDVNTLVRHRNNLLVHMPYKRHTTQIDHFIEVDHDRELLKKVMDKRWHVYENRPLRGVSELFSVMRKVVNTDSSRLRAIQDLLNTHPRLIVFYNFDYELEMLRSLSSISISRSSTSAAESSGTLTVDSRCPSEKQSNGLKECEHQTGGSGQCQTSSSSAREQTRSQSGSLRKQADLGGLTPDTTLRECGCTFVSRESNESTLGSPRDVVFAEWNGHKHEEIPKTDRWVYLVQYASGSEAWNCIDTDAMVFYSLTYSYKHFKQARGRIDRLNSPYEVMHYYIMRSEAAIDKAIWKNFTMKKSFNEKAFTLKT